MIVNVSRWLGVENSIDLEEREDKRFTEVSPTPKLAAATSRYNQSTVLAPARF